MLPPRNESCTNSDSTHTLDGTELSHHMKALLLFADDMLYHVSRVGGLEIGFAILHQGIMLPFNGIYVQSRERASIMRHSAIRLLPLQDE